MTYAIPIFNFFHITIAAIIPLIILMCFSIKAFKDAPKNGMLFIMLSFAVMRIVFGVLFLQEQKVLEDETGRWVTVNLLETALISALIFLAVIAILVDKKTLAVMLIASVILLGVVIDFYIWQVNVLENNKYYIPEYSCIGVVNEEIEDVIEINKYILEKEKERYKVLIMDIVASKYMIPMHRNNYKFDLLLDGNLGYNGEEKLIEEIKTIDNLLVIRQKPEVETVSIQQTDDIDEFIEKNYKKIGEINNLEIYN